MNSRDADELRSSADASPRSGGEPQMVGECTECNAIYPVQRTANGRLRPIGTDGTCACGNDEFESSFER